MVLLSRIIQDDGRPAFYFLIERQAEARGRVKILGASPEAFEFPDLKIEGTKQASGN